MDVRAIAHSTTHYRAHNRKTRFGITAGKYKKRPKEGQAAEKKAVAADNPRV
jgi:hypothetical protein